MKTLSPTAITQHHLDGATGFWLVETQWDQPDGADNTKFYGTDGPSYVLDSKTYQGILAAPSPIKISMARLKDRGGLSPVSNFSIRILDHEADSTVSDTHVLANDDVIVSFIYFTGSEVVADIIELVRGVMESDSTSKNLWSIKCKDSSRRDLTPFPTDRVDPERYPYSYAPGMPFPQAFGNLDVGPFDGVGNKPLLGRARVLDRWNMEVTSGLQSKTGGDMFQWYSGAGQWAQISDISETAHVAKIDHDDTIGDDGAYVAPTRTMRLYPARAKQHNNATTWYAVGDGNHSAGVTLVEEDPEEPELANSKLYFWMAGSDKIGEMTSISVVFLASGTVSHRWEIFDDTTSKSSGTNTGNHTETLTLADFIEWDLALLNIEIDGDGAETIFQVYIAIEFHDMATVAQSEPEYFQKVNGFDDQTAHYERHVSGGQLVESAVITGAGTVLRNPVHQIEALLRGNKMLQMKEAEVDAASTAAAAASRSTWKFDWMLDGLKREGLLDRMAFQAGCHLFKEGTKWKIAAMEKTRTPDHFYHGDYHMPVAGGAGDQTEWEHGLVVDPVDINSIINEAAIQYARNPGTGEYMSSSIASGMHRLTGTCTTAHNDPSPLGVASANGSLIDSSAEFVTDGVIAGERIFLLGDIDYSVVNVVSETQLTITPIGGGTVTANPGATYYLGPNLHGTMKLSQLSFKTVKALGTQAQEITDDAGFKSEFIADDDTADEFRDFIVDWFAQPRDKIRFPLWFDGLDLERGDVMVIEHPKLKVSKRGALITTTAEPIDTSETVIDVATGTGPLFNDDDYIYIFDTAVRPECMKVVSYAENNNQITVLRGQLGTEAVAHGSGDRMVRMTRKFLCTGVKPPEPGNETIEVEAVEMPNDYYPTGKVVVDHDDGDGFPLFENATEVQQNSSGWGTLRNNRVDDADASSALSFVGENYED